MQSRKARNEGRGRSKRRRSRSHAGSGARKRCSVHDGETDGRRVRGGKFVGGEVAMTWLMKARSWSAKMAWLGNRGSSYSWWVCAPASSPDSTWAGPGKGYLRFRHYAVRGSCLVVRNKASAVHIAFQGCQMVKEFNGAITALHRPTVGNNGQPKTQITAYQVAEDTSGYLMLIPAYFTY